MALQGTILMTGANGGLGTSIVRRIMARPDRDNCHGVYTVRDVAKATSLQSALRMGDRSHDRDILALDLSNLASVRDVAAAVNTKVLKGLIPPIRALILNAGYREPQGQTWNSSGFDTTFTSNYLGHWLLVLLLLQSMDRESSRVIVIGSWVHDPLAPLNKVNGASEELEWNQILAQADRNTIDSIARGTWYPGPGDPSKSPNGYLGDRRYAAAKLFSMMMIPELQHRLNSDPRLCNISILGVDPGVMPTAFSTANSSWFRRAMFQLATQVASLISPNGAIRPPHKSANDVLIAAYATWPPFSEAPKGLYLNGSVPKEISVEAKDTEKRRLVWEASVEFAELKKGETWLADWA